MEMSENSTSVNTFKREEAERFHTRNVQSTVESRDAASSSKRTVEKRNSPLSNVTEIESETFPKWKVPLVIFEDSAAERREEWHYHVFSL